MVNADFDPAHRRSIADPSGFWADAAEEIHWFKKWERVLDDSRPPSYRWFASGRRVASAGRRRSTRSLEDDHSDGPPHAARQSLRGHTWITRMPSIPQHTGEQTGVGS